MAYDAIVESSDPVLIPIDFGVTSTPDIVSWPWPKMIPSAYHTFVFVEGPNNCLQLFELTLSPFGVWDGNFVGVVHDNISNVEYTDLVDFGDWYIVIVATTLGIRNFAKLTGSELVELNIPIFGTGCNNRGQFVGGNIKNWQNLGSDGIAWSAIGNYEFDPSRDVTAGFKTLVNGKVPGKKVKIYRILPYVLGRTLSSTNGVIVYTDFGNIFLADSTVGTVFAYGLVELEGIGVASSNVVAGNQYTHMFVNLNNELCKYQRDNKLQVLGYKRQIESLKETQTPLHMSFLEDQNTFFLSNGVSTLVVNDFGGGIIHQAINGLVKGWNEQLYATFRDLGDHQGRIVLDSNSFDSRGKKTLEWIIADISHNRDTYVVGSAYWRNGASDEWRKFMDKSGSSSGEYYLGLSSVEYRPSLTFSQYEGSEIYGIKINIKFPDSRTRRGIAAISGVNTRGEGGQE